MTALLIIIGIIAFIFILLICPLSFSLVYDDKFEFKIRYLFLCFKFFPPKEKNNKTEKNKKEKPKKQKSKKAAQQKKSENKQEEQKENQFKNLIRQNGIEGLIELLKKVVETLLKVTEKITSHLIISKFKVNILVVGEDAADTAMKFGYVCSAVYPLVSAVDSHVKKCRHSENIVAGFNDSQTKVYCVLKARIKPLFLIAAFIPVLTNAVKFLLHR